MWNIFLLLHIINIQVCKSEPESCQQTSQGKIGGTQLGWSQLHHPTSVTSGSCAGTFLLDTWVGLTASFCPGVVNALYQVTSMRLMWLVRSRLAVWFFKPHGYKMSRNVHGLLSLKWWRWETADETVNCSETLRWCLGSFELTHVLSLILGKKHDSSTRVHLSLTWSQICSPLWPAMSECYAKGKRECFETNDFSLLFATKSRWWTYSQVEIWGTRTFSESFSQC